MSTKSLSKWRASMSSSSYGYHIEEAIKSIEASGTMSARQLALLEFTWFRALQLRERGAKNL